MPSNYDALPAYFFARPDPSCTDVALYEVRSLVIPSAGFMYVNVILPVETELTVLPRAIQYCHSICEFKAHVQTADEPIVTSVDFWIPGIQGIIRNGPIVNGSQGPMQLRGAEFVFFGGRESGILPWNDRVYRIESYHDSPKVQTIAPWSETWGGSAEETVFEEDGERVQIPRLIPDPPRRFLPEAPVLVPRALPFPPHVVSLLIQTAIAKGDPCPISLGELTAENATVTSCGHVFQRESIEHWLSDHSECPVCRSADIWI